jgi:catechol 2,3-dioxygenase-like lactoylglutathione lyase family enzyme
MKPSPRARARLRTLGVACRWLALAVLLAARVAGAEAAVSAVGPIAVTVSDADRMAVFLRDVLEFEPVADVEVAGDAVERLTGVFGARLRVVTMRLGDETLELREFLAPRGRAFPEDSRGNDRWFQHVAIVVSDMARAYAKLRAHDVEHASSGPQRLPDWNANAAGIEAFYFRDPDGHFLELIAFPPGKGDPRWQDGNGRLFLGIDHTAIVVGDTEASLVFYQRRLGLRVAGGSENWGTEQEHLNNVFGARLRITTLRAPAGPGVELLEYLAPRNGRPRPADARANDLLHWETALSTRDVAALGERLEQGAVRLPDDALGFREGFLTADPDGHVMRVQGETR